MSIVNQLLNGTHQALFSIPLRKKFTLGMSGHYLTCFNCTITKQRMPNKVKNINHVKSAHKNIFISTNFIHFVHCVNLIQHFCLGILCLTYSMAKCTTIYHLFNCVIFQALLKFLDVFCIHFIKTYSNDSEIKSFRITILKSKQMLKTNSFS